MVAVQSTCWNGVDARQIHFCIGFLFCRAFFSAYGREAFYFERATKSKRGCARVSRREEEMRGVALPGRDGYRFC